MDDVVVISRDPSAKDYIKQCVDLTSKLIEYGAVLVRDPDSNNFYFDRYSYLMEMYFKDYLPRQPQNSVYRNQPAFTPEKPQPTGRSLHSWTVCTPPNPIYQELTTANHLVPSGLSEWTVALPECADHMLKTLQAAAEMASIGLILGPDAFTPLMTSGPHQLVSTGTNLKGVEAGTILEPSHVDLNLLSIIGRSRYSPINIWSKNGEMLEVKLPIGYFLILAGKEMEFLTGGEVTACRHEIAVTDKTVNEVRDAMEAKDRQVSPWKISTTKTYPPLAAQQSTMELLPVIDSIPNPNMRFAKNPHLRQCFHISDKLRENGFLIVKDPEYRTDEHDTFIDAMETYFKVGVTPQEKTEIPSNSVPDPKFRYFWKIVGREELIADPVIPKSFSDFKETLDTCANKMLATVQAFAEMAAIGFVLHQQDAFTSKGPHVFVSTGIDLHKYHREGTVIKASQFDNNFLTIHDSSSFSGFNISLQNGEKIQIDVPTGCFLIMAGKQMEWLTGGDVMACQYEVIVTKKAALAINEAKELGRSLWRSSSALYACLAPGELMMPFGHFKDTAKRAKDYTPMHAKNLEWFAETNFNQ